MNNSNIRENNIGSRLLKLHSLLLDEDYIKIDTVSSEISTDSNKYDSSSIFPTTTYKTESAIIIPNNSVSDYSNQSSYNQSIQNQNIINSKNIPIINTNTPVYSNQQNIMNSKNIPININTPINKEVDNYMDNFTNVV